MPSIKLSYLESFLIQMVFYIVIWLANEYIASLLCLIIPIISAAILVISFLVELVEKSKVPKSYYLHMIIIILCPLLVGLGFTMLYGGDFDWLKPI